MQLWWRRFRGVCLVLSGLAAFGPAALAASLPAGVIGQPHPWEIALQPGFSPVKHDIIALNDAVTVIITVITAFVAGLLLWIIVRYNAKRNPVPSQVSHNTVLELAWTIIPILILVGIAIPSFRLVFYENKTEHPFMTIKVTGHQWYWEYTYPAEKIDYSSYVVTGKNLKPGQPRLLTAAPALVLPVGKNIRILETSGDVIHSFFIPSLGVQRYAIPGRLIETWVRIDQPGVFYGECNQICGTNHSRMPIEVRGVSMAAFKAWLATAKTKYAMAGSPGAAQRLAALGGGR